MPFQLTRQTLANAYDQLASGEEHYRVAIGNFMNAFFLDGIEDRQRLIDDPIQLPDHPTEAQLQWAAFCAGAAEYLAEPYDLKSPIWATNPAYTLSEPWYLSVRVNRATREQYQQTTPAAFRRRNVFCGDRVFSNTHPSSREPGSLRDLYQMREALLSTLTPDQRETYLAKRQGKPRVTIIT